MFVRVTQVIYLNNAVVLSFKLCQQIRDNLGSECRFKNAYTMGAHLPKLLVQSFCFFSVQTQRVNYSIVVQIFNYNFCEPSVHLSAVLIFCPPVPLILNTS